MAEQILNALTTDLQGRFQLQQDGLAEEDFPGFDAEAPHLRLGHLHDFPRAASSYWRGEKDSVSAVHNCWVGIITRHRELPQNEAK